MKHPILTRNNRNFKANYGRFRGATNLVVIYDELQMISKTQEKREASYKNIQQ